MRWSVYKVVRRGRALVPLGYVNTALDRAWSKWPRECDDAQVQRGFSVRPWTRDSLPLGKLHTVGA